MRDKKIVSVEEQGQLSKILKRFEKEKLNKLTSQPNDLNYLLKLMQHYEQLEDYSGHLKWFKESTPLSIDNYPRHKIFFEATKDHSEVLFMAANRSGKTHSAGFAVACWTTGIYPSWWKGRVFNKETKGWVCADGAVNFRESIQECLLGPHGALGTGMIPKDYILDVQLKHGGGGMFQTVTVKCDRSKNPSLIMSRTYEQGLKAYTGAKLDWVWEDEESPLDIHSECLIRTMTQRGITMLTFTPLNGLTPLVIDFKQTAKDLTEGLE